jgi:transcriptional antiterminator NusG
MDDHDHPETHAGNGAAGRPPGEGDGPVGGDDSPTMEWYVLKVTNNRERTIKASLERRIKREGMERFFGEIVIPTQKVVDAKGGKKRVVEQKRFPGYMMIQMHLNDESWHLVRDTSGVADFTGAAGKPIPMQPHEVEKMLGTQREEEAGAEPTKVKIDLSVGEMVKVKDGPFESFEGSVESVDETHGKINVLIEIFGRPTRTEFEYWQVEKV